MVEVIESHSLYNIFTRSEKKKHTLQAARFEEWLGLRSLIHQPIRSDYRQLGPKQLGSGLRSARHCWSPALPWDEALPQRSVGAGDGVELSRLGRL